MTKEKSDLMVCPLGEPSCEYVTEVAELRAQIERLSDLVHTDTLTGLSNYRYFIRALDQEMERTRRTGQPTCLMIIDIDFFKKVNDEWGHEVGNKALVWVARQMERIVRKMDAACRYGGEEFAIILPATSLADGVQIANRLKNTINETPLTLSGGMLTLSISAGVDVFNAGESGMSEDLIKRADMYLYQAKKSGRNKVCHPDLKPVMVDSSIDADEKSALFELFGGSE